MSTMRHSWCVPHMREEAAAALSDAKRSLEEAVAARNQARDISHRTSSAVEKNGFRGKFEDDFREKFEDEMRRRGVL